MITAIQKRDGRTVAFDAARITNAIAKAFKATGEARWANDDAAPAVTQRVIEALENRGVTVPTVEEVQDLVEKSLMELGYHQTAKAYILYREQHRQMRAMKSLVNCNLVESYLNRADWRVAENANSSFSLQGLNSYIANTAAASFWLERIYPPEVRRAHLEGNFHIHDLGYLSVYTYFGKEVVIAKDENGIRLISFEDLYASCEATEKCLNKADDAFAKYPRNLFVLDRDGWTKVIRLVRKKKDRPMRFIKNRGGRSIIVTDNHPMITGKGEKQAVEVQPQVDTTFTVDLNRLLAHEKLFSETEIDLLAEIKRYGGLNKKDCVHFNGVPIDEIEPDKAGDGYLHTVTQTIRRRIPLTAAFGYFIGFVLAEGYLTYDLKASQTISINQKDREPLLEVNKALVELGIPGCITRRNDNGMYNLEIRNVFLRFLFEKVFYIHPGARHKTLPVRLLHYNKNFVKGILAGLIDGDGSLNTQPTTISIRIASRTMLEQAACVMALLGLTPRDRNLEGTGTRRTYQGREIVQNYPLYGLSFRKTDVSLPSIKCCTATLSSKAWHDEDRDAWHVILNNEETDIPDTEIYDITTESTTLVVNGMWNHNCAGWDLKQLLAEGFGGVPNQVSSRPPKHFRSALGQMVNFLYTLQGEAAGAQAFSNVDTLLAPFVRADNLSYEGVRQAIQEFVFNLNVPTRTGYQTPFTNITMDLDIPAFMKDEPAVVGGQELNTCYGDYQEEVHMINEAFADVLLEGDACGRGFTFPIPTYNVSPAFTWKGPVAQKLFAVAAKYGTPYFANFINSDLQPEDVRSMCCRLRINNKELLKRGGGLFGASPLTGSIGVVTLNLPRLAYLAQDEQDFFTRLAHLASIAVTSLEIKRRVLERLTENGLYPYARRYLQGVKERTGSFWGNHFATLGLVGAAEAAKNLLGKSIGEPEGHSFAQRILVFLREFLVGVQERTGNLYNLEATPAEGCSYRLARTDKKMFPRILVANEEDWRKGAAPYYTNSTQLPVYETDDVFAMLEHQEPLQTLYTGGTVAHIFLGEALPDPEGCAALVRKVTTNYRLPYISVTPTYSVCPSHGYVRGEHRQCPHCGGPTEVYSRIVGYYRPVSQWNEGKKAEYNQRKVFQVN
jgi:ribonucleoside-triphosphate reductase